MNDIDQPPSRLGCMFMMLVLGVGAAFYAPDFVHELTPMLIFSYAALMGCVMSHLHHAQNFHGASRGAHITISSSATLGMFTSTALLVYYAVVAKWYAAIALFVVAGIVSGFIFPVLHRLFGTLIMTFASFLGWPLSAAWVMFVIRGLKH